MEKHDYTKGVRVGKEEEGQEDKIQSRKYKSR